MDDFPVKVFFPEAKPRNDHSGKIIGSLSFIIPVFANKHRDKNGVLCSKWFYSVKCSLCGAEKIMEFRSDHKDCGCVRKRKVDVKEKPREFDRRICIQYPFKCENYSKCADERLTTGKYSELFLSSDGKCYVPAEEQYKLGKYGDVHDII
jgi:hypothetical protein